MTSVAPAISAAAVRILFWNWIKMRPLLQSVQLNPDVGRPVLTLFGAQALTPPVVPISMTAKNQKKCSGALGAIYV